MDTATAVEVPEAVGPIEAATREGWEVWNCAFDTYAAYVSDLLSARGVADLCSANLRLAAAGADIVARAACDRQRWRGVVTPTLNEG